jgi:cytochrome c-type biogenesis protein CcmH
LALFALAIALVCPWAEAQLPGQSERAQRVGKRLMCMCGCNQVLVECNHVGCSRSTDMLQELDQRMARGESDDLILQSFIQEYGQKVLTEPPSSGFGLAGWLMPVLFVLTGFVVVRAVLIRWRQRPALAGASPAISPELLDRASRETDVEAELAAMRKEKGS